jgi:hypothetical protein
MEEVRDRVYRQETVRLDGKLFYNRSFEDCLLCCGGERCEWENTKFANCRVVLDGSANNTVQVLQGFGFQGSCPTWCSFSLSSFFQPIDAFGG